MKVLFLTLAFPPANMPASTRTWNMARELARNGCEVTVLTLRPDAWRRTDSPRGTAEELRSIRRIDVPPRWTFLAPWELRSGTGRLARLGGGIARRIARAVGVGNHAGWQRETQRACNRLTANDVDVILATGSPFESFEVARRTGRRLGRPFVIDYRDPWTSNPHGDSHPRARRKEAAIVAAAAAVTVVSPSWLELLQSEYALGAKGHVVTNGFDEEELSGIVPWPFDHFALVYAGQFYPPKRSAAPLFAALRGLESRVPGWKFHYLGSQEEHVRAAAAEHGLSERVVCHGMIPRKESLAAMAGAAVSVVITSVEAQGGTDDFGILPSKVFDSIGLCAPLLVISPPGGDIEKIVRERPLTATLPAHDAGRIVDFLASVAASKDRAPAMPQYSWQRRGHVMKQILEEAAHAR